jgi:hypothetical protein
MNLDRLQARHYEHRHDPFPFTTASVRATEHQHAVLSQLNFNVPANDKSNSNNRTCSDYLKRGICDS